jgi:hypothetical protein
MMEGIGSTIHGSFNASYTITFFTVGAVIALIVATAMQLWKGHFRKYVILVSVCLVIITSMSLFADYEINRCVEHEKSVELKAVKQEKEMAVAQHKEVNRLGGIVKELRAHITSHANTLKHFVTSHRPRAVAHAVPGVQPVSNDRGSLVTERV